MKPEIEKRMNHQIANARIFNTIFDIVVETTENTLGSVATNPEANQFNVTSEDMFVTIVCNDNEWATVTVGINIPAPDTGGHVADVQINSLGNIEEDYHNIPRSMRSIIFGLVDSIAEAIDGYINPEEEI